MVAGQLEVIMSANIARLAADMNQAKQVVTGAMDKIGSVVGKARAALGALGIGLGVGVFTAMIKGSIDAMDHLNDLSKTTDIAVEKLAGLSLAAKQTGSDLDGTAQAISKLSQNIGKEPEKFRALGISAKDPLEAFKQLADLFVLLEDPQQRAAVMAAALGKSWATAAPMLAEGGEKIQEMIDKGQRLSGITKEMAGGADDFNDKLAEFEARSKGFQYALATALLPHLSKAADVMMEMRKNTDDGKASIEAAFVPVKVLASGFIALGGGIAAASRFVVAHALVLDKLAHFDFKGAWDEYKLGVSEAKARLDGTAAVVAELWKKNDEGAKKAGESTKGDAKAKADAAARAKQFLKEEKTGAQDVDSAYRSLLRSLKEKLEATEELTEVTRLELALEAMSAKQLVAITPLRRQELMDLARKIDLKKQEKVALDAYLKSMQMDLELEQEISELMKNRSPITGEILAGREQNKIVEDLEFEAKTLAMTNEQRDIAVALRALEASGLNKLGAEYEKLGLRIVAAIKDKNAIQEAVDLHKAATDEITEFWRQAARNMQDGMADFFFDIMQGKLDDLGTNFKRTIDRMVANALAANLAEALFSKSFLNDGGALGGLIGKGLDALDIGGMFGRAPVSDAILVPVLGGAADGMDYVPRTGPYLLHEGERVLTKDENARGSGARPLVFNLTQNLGQGVSLSSANQAAVAAGRRVQRAIERDT